MSYHETLWVVAGTAAPVIALAAVVAIPNTLDAYQKFAEPATDDFVTAAAKILRPVSAATEKARKAQIKEVAGDERKLTDMERAMVTEVFTKTFRPLRYWIAVIRWAAIGNVLLQAGLLAVSLMALTYGRDVVPPLVAIFMAVGGILILALTVSEASDFPNLYAALQKRGGFKPSDGDDS